MPSPKINPDASGQKSNIMTNKKLKSVFIVDDSAIERSMLTDHLSKNEGVEIKEFSNGESCIKELVMGNVQEPDLILMDYFLETSPGSQKDGLEVLTKLKEICPDSQVIMLTSVSNEKIKELAKNKGALDYVVKSQISYQQLDDVLQKHFS